MSSILIKSTILDNIITILITILLLFIPSRRVTVAQIFRHNFSVLQGFKRNFDRFLHRNWR